MGISSYHNHRWRKDAILPLAQMGSRQSSIPGREECQECLNILTSYTSDVTAHDTDDSYWYHYCNHHSETKLSMQEQCLATLKKHGRLRTFYHPFWSRHLDARRWPDPAAHLLTRRRSLHRRLYSYVTLYLLLVTPMSSSNYDIAALSW